MQLQYNNSKIEVTSFELSKIETVESLDVYKRFINWVSGEFDLYLQQESKNLKVYFPNGSFKIEARKINHKCINIEVSVKGKSTVACKKIIKKLECIYNNVLLFNKK